jgi:CIC family chloride channel protein
MNNKILTLYALAGLLGTLVGIVSSALQLSIKGFTLLLHNLYSSLNSLGIPVIISSSIASMVLVFIAWMLVKYCANEASGSGVPEIEGALLHLRKIFWKRLLPAKFIGGILSLSAKMVLGREGPTIQLGGNLGAMVGEGFALPQKRRDIFIAAGAAAGLAAAFNAPLAGVLFVLEEMREQFMFSFTNFTAVVIATVFATIINNCIMGTAAVIPMPIIGFPPLNQLWLFFPFGILVGFVGLLFNRALILSLCFMDTLYPWQKNLFVLLVGAAVGLIAPFHPEMVGGGYGIIEKAVTMHITTTFLLVTLLVRFIFTLLSYNTGVPGGFFAPMLAMGTLFGLVISNFFALINPELQTDMFAVAGMGALFAAAVRAPVTGILLVVEMTQNYFLILPLMITCLTATTVCQLANNKPIYTQLLERTLRKGRKSKVQ